MRIIWKIIEKLLILVLILAVLSSGWMMFQRKVLNEDLPSIFGYKRAVVLSGSMEPTFSVGDVVVFKEQSEYQIGDVIIFHQGEVFVTHRIVGENEYGFITQGDANNVEDSNIVLFEDIEGKMVGVLSGVGNITNFFQTPIGLVCLIIIGVLIIEVPSWLDEKKKAESQSENKTET